MRHAVRYLFVMVTITTMALAGSGALASAAVPLPQPVPAVAAVLPANGAVVGVAHPVVVTFTAPVLDRRAAERTIRVTSPSNMTGHFEWVDSFVVQWIPDHYWPTHSQISVDAQELTDGFETGDELLGVASISAHTFTVSRNGEVLRTMPASMGKPSRPTPIGNFSALSKERTVVMDSRTIGIPLNSSDGYLITASYAVRVTWSGVYVHSAPWSVNSQGYANVSHGCINLSPDNAAWYFNTVNVGDPIEVVA
ncbi:L,D-transpeptidase [Mycobacterium pseudokansasii]|uniref:L,D-transpeptidase 1 n=1 Tax=Mycobacterium pseudokansasii TaxID=2341080 RepID=A0A498QNT7_9MYCO|nr:L,D-transpeptidase [Mycobacterium pseudokansasii]VBA45944.1 L,D-transpeptidase 1 [Mycobacterium pseudokansasii]